MSVTVNIVDGPLGPPSDVPDAGAQAGRAGARVVFEGIVRGENLLRD